MMEYNLYKVWWYHSAFSIPHIEYFVCTSVGIINKLMSEKEISVTILKIKLISTDVVVQS